MKPTKEDIKQLKKALAKANKLEIKAQSAAQELAIIIEKITGVVGYVDYLSGDGFGFTPESNNDTHIAVDAIIKVAKEGKDITEDFILDNLSF